MLPRLGAAHAVRSFETARVHYASRRRRDVVARGADATAREGDTHQHAIPGYVRDIFVRYPPHAKGGSRADSTSCLSVLFTRREGGLECGEQRWLLLLLL